MCIICAISNKGIYVNYVTVLFISPKNYPYFIEHSNDLYIKCNNSDRPDVNKRTSNVFILMGISRQAIHTERQTINSV